MSDRTAMFDGGQVVYPEEFEACTVPVLHGEYAAPVLPDEPTGALRVLDCGAGVGAFTLFARHRFGPITATCVEPDPLLAGYVRRNVPQATLIEAAISLDPTGATLYRGPHGHYGYNSIVPAIGNPYGSTIQVSTVHPHKLPPCDILKLDIEGAEVDMLSSYHHLGSVWWVMLEWHKENLRQPCEKLLQQAGLRCVWGRWLDVDAGLQTWARTGAKFNRGTWAYYL